jgi:hypothetical protein
VAVVPVLAIGVIVWMLTSLQRREWAGLGAVVGVAVVIFAVTRPSRLRALRSGIPTMPDP